jgi:hypothetical protein
MWRLLTLNVSVLPLLALEQWQTLFEIIAIAASSGGYASIKSFEVIDQSLFAIYYYSPTQCPPTHYSLDVGINRPPIYLFTYLFTYLN